MKHANRALTVLIFVFLYIPMAVLIVASFNTGKDITHFDGFTFNQYLELFKDDKLLNLLANSLIISSLATATATVFGTVAAVGIHNLKPRLRKVAMSLTNIPMTNPDIVTGVSLSLLFVFVGTKLLGQRESLTFWTLLIAHITFNLPYVVLNVMPKLHQMDSSLVDAAMDLGCTPLQSFFKVTIHEIMPGIITGAIMSFTMSLDDFVISYFVTGMGFTTLPVEIYSYVKKPIQPKIYAMFTLLFVLIFVLMVVMNILQLKGEQNKKRNRSAATETRGMRTFKRVVAVAVSIALIASVGGFIFFARFGAGEEQVTLNVYNWGQYISEGDEGYMDVIGEFEKEYPNIRVNYVTFDSNETMYTKMSNGGITVDVIIPSDYMVGRLAQEGMLRPLNYENIPNFQYIDEPFRNRDYDPENLYTVPYTWGTVGIIYNTAMVDEPIDSWSVMFDEKYADEVLMINNSRDALMAALCYLGYDINTTDEAQLQEAFELVRTAKANGVYQGFVMDEIYQKMEGGNAAISMYYAGDYLTMLENNEDLAFVVPKEGSNWFVDAMCVLETSQHKEEAEAWINFIASTEANLANMDYIWYASPNTEALEGYPAYYEELYEEELDSEIYEIMAAPPEVLDRCEMYLNLPQETLKFYDKLWTQLGI